jgi:acyl carrier protein
MPLARHPAIRWRTRDLHCVAPWGRAQRARVRRATIHTVQYGPQPLPRDTPWTTASNMHSHEEVLDRIRSTLVELFELPSEDITPEARLYEDLEIDSIDVIDLMDEMHRRTGVRRRPRTSFGAHGRGDAAAHEMKRIADSGRRIVRARQARPRGMDRGPRIFRR